MACSSNKYSSKRRAAALKFLSNISLDSSPQINFHGNLNCYEETDIGISDVNEVITSRFIDPSQTARHPSITPMRERSNTGNRELMRKREKRRKITDEYPFLASHSSSESLASTLGGSKQRVDFDSKLQKLREVKIVRASFLRSYKNERIMLAATATKTPFYVFSFVPYKKIKSKNELKRDLGSRRRNLSGSRPLSSFIDTLDPFLLLGLEKCQDAQMTSYEQLLIPACNAMDLKDSSYQQVDISLGESIYSKSTHISRCLSVDLGVNSKPYALPSSSPPFSDLKTVDWDELVNSSQDCYSPFQLDDPELMSGKHRTVLTFPSYRASIIDYVRPSDLKKELNEKFREKFPYVQLTLSKLRSLKRDMKKISKNEKCADLLTVAQAYVYFEKLILRNVISKTNRKLCAAVCLLLSAKMNDIKGLALKQLLDKLESVFRLNRKDVLALEFAVVVAMEFNLHVPTWEILPHYQRLAYES